MIQTATPTTTNLQETPQGGPVKKAGAAKKEPLGVFAKILAGLLRNTRGLSPETQGKAETVKTLQKNAPPEGGKALSRNRKKAPSPREEGEAGAVLAAFPEGNSPPAEKLLLRASPETAQGLKNEEKAPPDKLSPPVSPGSSKPKIREGEPGFRLNRPAEAVPPREEAAPGELPAFLTETPPPETPADKRELSRNRKAAPSEEPRVMPEPSGKIPENPQALSLQWGEIKNAPATGEERGRTNRPGEERNRRRERLGLEVRDFRGSPALSEGAGEIKNTLSPRLGAGSGEAELFAELPSAEEGTGEGDAPEAAAGERGFENLLARELRQNLGGDIVRSARIILRDGGEGTIRLSLKPESLGNVKIRLEMAENKVTGHIIVENDAARKAFEGELPSLEQAFMDAGFDGADLDTALAFGGGQNREGRGEDKRETGPFFSRQLAAATYDASLEGEEGAGGDSGYGIFRQINMLV